MLPAACKYVVFTTKHHEGFALHDSELSLYDAGDILWWDYSSFGFDGDEAWRAGQLIEMCREAQPDVIMNNRLFRRPEAGFSHDGGADLSQPLDPRFGDLRNERVSYR